MHLQINLNISPPSFLLAAPLFPTKRNPKLTTLQSSYHSLQHFTCFKIFN